MMMKIEDSYPNSTTTKLNKTAIPIIVNITHLIG